MNKGYEVLGWNEQNVLTLPPFHRYLFIGFVQLFSKLFIIIPSALMIATIPELSKHEWCSGISVIYGTPAILSIQFATILVIVDFIIPCVTNKQIKVLITGISFLLCFILIAYYLVIAIFPFHNHYKCQRFESYQGRYDGHENYHEFKKFAYGFYLNTLICLGGWVMSEVVSAIQLYIAYRKL